MPAMSPERRRAIDFACYEFVLGCAFNGTMEALGGTIGWHCRLRCAIAN
jgi:hypothetical protein